MKHTAADTEALEHATLYALGALGPDESAAFEGHLADGCDVCRQEIDSLSSVNAALSFDAPRATPPARTRESLLTFVRRTDRAETEAKTDAAAASPPLLTVREEEGDWQPLLEGVTIKRLYVDQERGTVTSLFRLQPGAFLPTHTHAGTEQCLVLEGDMRTGEIVLHRGDYHCAPKGSRHPTMMSVTGALLLIIAHAGPEAYAF